MNVVDSVETVNTYKVKVVYVYILFGQTQMTVTFSIKTFLRPLPEFYFQNSVVIYLNINCKDSSSVVIFSCEKLKGLPQCLFVCSKTVQFV